MKFLFASDSFKGTLSSTEISDLLEISAFRHFPGCSCVKVPIADGGEGTVDAIMRAAGKSSLKWQPPPVYPWFRTNCGIQ